MQISFGVKNRWNRNVGLAAVAVLLSGLTSCATDLSQTSSDTALALPSGLERGAARYETLCASCHGKGAAGTQQGPPLVHDLYVRGHHRDSAFRRAFSQGVEAHHWPFGNMPPVPDVTPEDAAAIIEYIRALHQSAGIY
jgi:mono/diheme cytochrome c family protein